MIGLKQDSQLNIGLKKTPINGTYIIHSLYGLISLKKNCINILSINENINELPKYQIERSILLLCFKLGANLTIINVLKPDKKPLIKIKYRLTLSVSDEEVNPQRST